MVTLLAGGTGTPKLLAGADAVFPPADQTVVANTGDDAMIGGTLVCPDLDTLLYLSADRLDTDTWWGVAGDTSATHDARRDTAGRLAERDALRSGDGDQPTNDVDDADEGSPRSDEAAIADPLAPPPAASSPYFLPADRQTEGRPIARWRRFAGVGEFMRFGDRDRAVHADRTALLDQGYSLTEATALLAQGFDVDRTLLPMSDDPVATLVEAPTGRQHFQEWWVANDGGPAVDGVVFEGANEAAPTEPVIDALDDSVVIGPSNPVTSIEPILALDGVVEALDATTVVAVSPFLGDEAFSGPAAKLMGATGRQPGTASLPEVYPFADAVVADAADDVALAVPTVETDTRMDDAADAERVARAAAEALELVR